MYFPNMASMSHCNIIVSAQWGDKLVLGSFNETQKSTQQLKHIRTMSGLELAGGGWLGVQPPVHVYIRSFFE